MASPRSLLLAAAVLLLAGVFASVSFEPLEAHTLATCALLIAGGTVVARGRPPGWWPRGRRVAVFAPAALTLALLAGTAAVALGPLQVEFAAVAPSAQGALVVLAVPAAEELFFRGALLRLFPDHRAASVAVSAVVFGLLHHALGWPVVWCMTFAGLGLGALALTLRAVAVPIVVHAAFNGLVVAYQEDAPLALLLPVLAGFGLSFGGWWRSRD